MDTRAGGGGAPSPCREMSLALGRLRQGGARAPRAPPICIRHCFGQSCQNACTDDLEYSDEDEVVDVITNTSPLHTPVNYLSDEENFSMPGPWKNRN